jgi:hypothetical protein
MARVGVFNGVQVRSGVSNPSIKQKLDTLINLLIWVITNKQTGRNFLRPVCFYSICYLLFRTGSR